MARPHFFLVAILLGCVPPAVADVGEAESALRAARLLDAAATADASLEAAAEAAYREVVERHPEFAAGRVEFGSFLMERGREAAAIREWAVAHAAGSAEAASRLGAYHLQTRGDAKQAAKFLAEAVAAEGGVARYHFDLANVLCLFRHDLGGEKTSDDFLRDALGHFRRATELAPLDAGFARAYAEAFYLMPDPDWDAALAAWERATELMADKDFGRIHLARVSLRKGDGAGAEHFLASIESPRYDVLRARFRAQIAGDPDASVVPPAGEQ